MKSPLEKRKRQLLSISAATKKGLLKEINSTKTSKEKNYDEFPLVRFINYH